MTEVMQVMEAIPINLKKLKTSGRTDSANSNTGTSAALRILEPGRKKLSSVETQRIIECLDDCIRRQELASALLLVLIPNEERLEQFCIGLGPDLLAAIKTHRDICNSLDESCKTKDDETTASLQSQVTESCKTILRMFREDISIATSIRSELGGEYGRLGGKPVQEAQKLLEGLHEIRAIMLERLLTTPSEESDRSRYLQQVTEREKSNAAVIEKLQIQLDAAIDDKEQEMGKKNDIIRRLKNDLHQIEQFSEEHIKRTKTEADKQQSSDSRSSEVKQTKLTTEIDQLNDQLNRMVQEDREIEQQLRKKKFKIETEVENWINKYDQDMGEKQDEYEHIDAIYTEEKKQLSELEEKFKVLEEEYDKIMEERRIAREEKEARELELQHMIKAAITVQAFFRAYKVRKALKAKAKKGGKGKGKGKGKKKK